MNPWSKAEAATKNVRPGAEEQRIWDAWDAMADLLSAAKKMKSDLKLRVAEYLEEEGGEIYQIMKPGETSPDDRRLRLAPDNKVKPKATPGETLDRLLTLSAGDMEPVERCLSAGAWKQGEVKELFGEDVWGELFVREEGQTVVTAKPTKKQRKIVEEKFAFVSKRWRGEFREVANDE